MRRALSLCLLSFACARRVEEPPPPPRVEAGAYYPLAVGNQWAYDANFLGQKVEMVVELVGQSDGYFVDNRGNKLAVDAFGVRDDKRYLLREPVEPGRTWTNVVSVQSVEHYRILDAGASCEVPAGRFERCVRVESRNRVDARTTLVNEMTFALGVGLVRIATDVTQGDKRIPQTRMVLKSFQLASARAE